MVPALFVFLNEQFGEKWDVESSDILTVHAITGTQPVLDKRPRTSKNLGATQSIILTGTGAGKATAPILPELDGKIDANSLRINSPDGSFTVTKSIVTVPEGIELTPEVANQRFRYAAETKLNGIETALRDRNPMGF